MSMKLSLRSVTAGELETFARVEARANNRHATQEYVVHGQHSLATERTLAAFAGDELVATSVSHAFRLSVPGGEVKLGGIGWVAVLPTHRRRGIMTQLIHEHLRASYERGDCLSGLWPTGGNLYARYGYAICAFGESWRIEHGNARLNSAVTETGRLISLHTPDSRRRFPDVYARLREQRGGVIERDEIFWDVEFEDHIEERRGTSSFFFTAYEFADRLDGYLKYRIDERGRELHVSELIATTLEASTALWAYCFALDQIDTISAWNRPVDDPLPWQVSNPRAVNRSVHDTMWLRLVDVRRALTARTYATKERLVLHVVDAVCPWNDGVYELDSTTADVTCERSTAPADLTLDVSILSAMYLGGVSPVTLHRAGALEQHRAGTVTRLASMFSTELPPWTPHEF